jgi:hypothetical protein
LLRTCLICGSIHVLETILATDTIAPCAERDDRYHDDPNHGDPDAPADRVVFVMLFGLALAASLLAGYGMTGSKVRRWFHMLGFALVMAFAVYSYWRSSIHAWV